MPFRNPIVAGEELTIEAIRSENYVENVSGWRIAKNGVAQLIDAIILGTLKSDNYVPGVSGWQITKAGVAEFLNATITGTVKILNDY